MVESKLQDGVSAALWTVRFFLYTVILAFSATIVGLDGRKADNIWNDSLFYDGKFVDFCAYSASSVEEGGDHGACRYVMALASISLILVFFLWLFTFVDALYPVLTMFWFIELGINVFQTMWWLVGAIVVYLGSTLPLAYSYVAFLSLMVFWLVNEAPIVSPVEVVELYISCLYSVTCCYCTKIKGCLKIINLTL
ncbi:hypothetical protein Gasu2_44650 [Galdieria sulphuraria]|nr:hypothetical protein Gasu2_44650 [Galdieria sulphuraria]